MKKLLVTSALPYANGDIHLGHLVEYIFTDIWVRFWKLLGREVAYLCADDAHGTPIMLKARDEGVEPEDLIRQVGERHVRDFKAFQIEFDCYYTTHSEENRRLSAEVFAALQRNGSICERKIEQAYCDVCAMFLPDRYVLGRCPRCGATDQYGDSCEVCAATYTPRELVNAHCASCGAAPGCREATHLYFHLADFSDRLQQWLHEGRLQGELINKLAEWFRAGLQDWDISREAPYFGFEIPGYPGKYFYVWLDAPIGYMATTLHWCRLMGGDFNAYWRSEETEVVHFIGKDIVYFHALFWPALLMGSGFRTPTRLCVHGFLTVNGEKMSKSRGTFITAEKYLRHLDPQYLRYYYACKLSSGIDDLDLSLEDFTNRVNADLVNRIANIPSRTLAVLHRHCGGRLGQTDEAGRALIAAVRNRCDEAVTLYEGRKLSHVSRLINELASTVNIYLEAQRPWVHAASDSIRAANTCTSALNAFRIVATLIQPILPEFGRQVAAMLDLPALTWAGLDDVLEDRPVRPYVCLAKRILREQAEAITNDQQ